MLVIGREVGQDIRIGPDITIKLVRVHGDKVRIGITAPRDVEIHRAEVYEYMTRMRAEKGKD